MPHQFYSDATLAFTALSLSLIRLWHRVQNTVGGVSMLTPPSASISQEEGRICHCLSFTFNAFSPRRPLLRAARLRAEIYTAAAGRLELSAGVNDSQLFNSNTAARRERVECLQPLRKHAVFFSRRSFAFISCLLHRCRTSRPGKRCSQPSRAFVIQSSSV